MNRTRCLMKRWYGLLAFGLTFVSTQTMADTNWLGAGDSFVGNPRIVVLTGIGNEPAEQRSLLRLLED